MTECEKSPNGKHYWICGAVQHDSTVHEVCRYCTKTQSTKPHFMNLPTDMSAGVFDMPISPKGHVLHKNLRVKGVKL